MTYSWGPILGWHHLPISKQELTTKEMGTVDRDWIGKGREWEGKLQELRELGQCGKPGATGEMRQCCGQRPLCGSSKWGR